MQDTRPERPGQATGPVHISAVLRDAMARIEDRYRQRQSRVLTRLPSIRLSPYGRTMYAWIFACGQSKGFPAGSLTSYGACRRMLLDRHGVYLRIAAIERAASPKKSKAAWDRMVRQAMEAAA